MNKNHETFEKDPMTCKAPHEMSFEELEETIDDDCKRMGLTLAKVYKTVSLAMLSLPNMELHTEMMCVTVDDYGITVCIRNPDADEEDYEDDDEGDEDFEDDNEDHDGDDYEFEEETDYDKY